ncbi:MAG: FAD-dependent oxidoreductase [Coriobacteriales bacterium]|nr:FAD-dependent oxidoreductase [Coriobacteriales bacterium]
MSDTKYRVAVVGAGAAGAMAAYRLWQRLGVWGDITVYERNEHAGGRAWDVNWAGTRIEVGGSILHSSGQYTMELMDFTGCKEGQSGLSIDGKDETYAFWTSEGFPILTHTSLASMGTNIVKHTGPVSALKLVRSATAMADKWGKIYEILKSGELFDTPQDMLRRLGLFSATQISLRGELSRLNINDKMINDVVEPIVHNMYNQGGEIAALAGEVGLAGAGLAGGYLFCIDGGNWTLYDKTLRKIGANLRYNTKVERIEAYQPAARAENGHYRYRVYTNDDDRGVEFDAVILAAPLALADLSIDVDGQPLELPIYPYQEVQTTLVAGELNPEYFGADPAKKLPSTIFTADSTGAPFKSIGITGYSPQYESRIYKIFSAEHVMTEAELDAIFSRRQDTMTFVWRGAYPIIRPATEHVPFVLQPGLYYACAFETAAGAIEVESVGGFNVATKCAQYLEG